MDGPSKPERLDSWKQIAAYLNVTVRTSQRWERTEGLPVRRHRHAALSSVFAYPAEIDAWWNSRPAGEGKPLASGAKRSIAVLPFENLTRAAADEIFSDGLTEEVIATLARIEGLQVIARTSVFHFKGKTADIRSLAARLGVTLILEGSVRRSGDRLRITVQLIDAAEGAHIWSERYDRGSSDILDLQDEIAHAISDALRSRISPGAAPPRLLHDPRAYEMYLEGRYHARTRSAAGLIEAVRCFEEAVVRDPRLAPAWGALAFHYILQERLAGGVYGEALAKARRAAEEALRLDPGSADAFVAIGTMSATYDYDWISAENHFRRGLAVNPHHAGLHLFYPAQVLGPLGRFAEAELHSVHACELDPFSAVPAAALGIHYAFTRSVERAEAACARAMQLDPAYPWTHWALGQVLLQQGRLEEATCEFRQVPPVLGAGFLGYCLARAGNTEEARRLQRELDAPGAFGGASLSYQTAVLHFGLGEHDEAFEWLERARSERGLGVQWVAVDPIWDAIRQDVRFGRFLQRMNIAHDTLAVST